MNNNNQNSKIIFLFLLLIVGFIDISAKEFQVPGDEFTIIVKPERNNTVQIQNALSYKTNKWLRIILEGTFYVDKTLQTKKEKTIIEFSPNSKIIFTNTLSSGINIIHNNCIIRNGKITGTGKSSNNFYKGYGILLSGVDNCEISNVTLEKISGNNILLLQSRGKGCSNNIIKNNSIVSPVFKLNTSGDEAGILLGYSGNGYSHNNNTIDNNIIDGNNILKIGIGIIGHGVGNTFKNNRIHNCRNYGIICYESQTIGTSLSKSNVNNNIIRNIGEIENIRTPKGMGIYLMKSSNSIVSNNKVYDTLKNSDRTETLPAGSISINGSPYTIVKNNLIDGSQMYGIASAYSFNSQFMGNTIQNTRKSGAYFINMNDVIVKGNIFKNIGEVVIKGYFEDTSRPNLINQIDVDVYKNIPTGENFVITENTFYTDHNILYFTGTNANLKQNYKGNKVKNNKFEDNRIFGNNKKILTEKVAFRIDEKGTNTIKNNKFSIE